MFKPNRYVWTTRKGDTRNDWKAALKNAALRLAGATAIVAAGYHAVVGDKTIRAIEMAEDDMAFVSSTFQLGTMGWVAGGVLLLGAAGVADQQARNWIVGVTAALYGLPALGTLTLTGGKPSLGGALLAAATALALYGRRVAVPVQRHVRVARSAGA